jgi:hypothetical protein
MSLTQRLPSDIENLIDVTIELADLIYWRPTTNLTDYHQLMANVAPAARYLLSHGTSFL